MNTNVKLKQLALAAGDILVLYLALGVTLFTEYHTIFPDQIVLSHLKLFSYIFVSWILVFYIAGLYELQHLKNNQIFIKKLGTAMIVNFAIAIAFFYVLPLKIAPKTNLIILIASFTVLEYLWRYSYNQIISAGLPLTNTLLIGAGKIEEDIANQIKNNPQLGYCLKLWLKKNELNEEELEQLNQSIVEDRINLVVIPNNLKRNSEAAHIIYRNLASGLETLDSIAFYEMIYNKIPIRELKETWFLENLVNRHRIYETIKQPLEIIIALTLMIILLPLFPLIALLVKTSKGPVIYKQKRVGQYGIEFTLYKFRTMRQDAEKHGVRWWRPGDDRVTAIGSILRHTHLDELPQLINIIKGELSFIGPRPERPEFVEKLKTVIPHYELRHLVRPGLTGWAQLNYRYGSSIEDTEKKLEYDFYYLKNRSPWLDLAIILKTLKLFFVENT